MHFLILGGAGFIGRRIVAGLLGAGHRITAAVRSPATMQRIFPGIEVVRADLNTGFDWRRVLTGVDVVVNAAGVLRGPELEAVHVTAPRELYAACREAGVRRVILISAISARPEVQTDYSRTKLEGETVLKAACVPWTILRPSLVIAKGSYGGTSVLRGLAGFPLLTPVLELGEAAVFSPIHADDLARTVRIVAEDDWFAGQVLEPCGPDTLSLAELVRAYRGWLGLPPAPQLPIPGSLGRGAARLGDVIGSGPISTTSLNQLAAGNAGDGAGFAAAIGFAPKSLAENLAADPADVQDRWHARLFFPAIGVRASLVVLWLASGLVGLFAAGPATAAAMQALGLPTPFGWPLQLGTCLLDLALAALLLVDHRGRLALWAQLIVVLGYTLVLTVALPHLWADPFGPLLKNLPILMLIGVNAVLTDQR